MHTKAVAGLETVSESTNQFAFIFPMLDSRFIASTARLVCGFWHRHLFTDQAAMTSARPSVTEGTHLCVESYGLEGISG